MSLRDDFLWKSTSQEKVWVAAFDYLRTRHVGSYLIHLII